MTTTRTAIRRCPAWCESHSEADDGTPDHHVLHLGAQRESAGVWVRLARNDMLRTGVTGEVEVFLDDEPVRVTAAIELVAVLSMAVADALGPDDKHVVVRVLDLPEGQDFMVFNDINMVGVSRRLDAAGRRRALMESGAQLMESGAQG